MFRAKLPARGLVAALGLAAAAAAAAATGACRDVTAPEQDPTTVKYSDSLVAQLGLNIATFTHDTSGVYYKDIAVGSGTLVTKGATVGYYYTGYLANGRLFDTDTSLTSPLTFVVGGGGVIRGLDRGVIGMHALSRRVILIPPALGYGNQSQGTRIPAGSVLIFDVYLPTVTAPTTTTTTSRSPR